MASIMHGMLALLVLALIALAINTYAQDVVKVITPHGEKTLRKTAYVEVDVLYTSKYGMAGIVDEVAEPTIIHVQGIGYVRLADITVPSTRANEAVEFLRDRLLDNIVYLDIDDVNVFDPQGYILAVVYLQENPNISRVVNVNLLLVSKGYAVILDIADEFKPSTWKLVEYLNETTTTTATTTATETTTVTTTIVITATQTATTPTPGTTTTQPVSNTTTTTIVNATNTTLPANETSIIGGGPVLIISSTPPPQPPPSPVIPPATTKTKAETRTKTTTTPTQPQSQPYTGVTLSTVTRTVTITRVSYVTITEEKVTPFYATTPGIIMISILSALIGSLVTIILLRKYVTS